MRLVFSPLLFALPFALAHCGDAPSPSGASTPPPAARSAAAPDPAPTAPEAGPPAAPKIRPARATNLPTRSTGCSIADPTSGPDAPHDVRTADGRHLAYFLPAQFDAEHSYPVLVLFHGLGARVNSDAPEANFENFVRLQEIAADAIVVYLETDTYWSSAVDLPFFDAALADVASRTCADLSRVYVLGYSMGAYMAQQVGCERPGVVKALVAASGGWPGLDPDTCGQIPTLVYGRQFDPDEVIGNSRNARDQKLLANQCDPTPLAPPAPLADDGTVRGCVGYAGCANGAAVSYCEDPQDLVAFDRPAYENHTLWQPYRAPMWNWLTSQP